MGKSRASQSYFIPALGNYRISELDPSAIRQWQRLIATEVGIHTAARAKMFLKAALAMAAEDFGFPLPPMPSTKARYCTRQKKQILRPFEVGALISAAQRQLRPGLYVVFPFLTGTRPSEQLGLLWEDVDFENGSIRIQRMQERDGNLTSMTKSAAGTRSIPMLPVLKEMLLDWRNECPSRAGDPPRVFPSLGRSDAKGRYLYGGGGPLIYTNFRGRVWRRFLGECGLPIVTPHSARHTYISTLQSQGIEVGLVAELAGHADPNVTLAYYTQSVRDISVASAALERAFVTKKEFRMGLSTPLGAKTR